MNSARPELASPAAPAAAAAPAITSKLLVLGALGVLLYVAHAAFIPVALAFLFALILSGPVEALHKRKFPRSASATVILLLALSGIGAAGTLLWTPAQTWFAKAPHTMAIVKQKIGPIAKFTNRIDELRKSAGNMGVSTRAPVAAAATPTGENGPVLILDATASAIAALLTFVIVTLFLLTGGPPMLARMTAAFADNVHSSHVLRLIDKVRAEVGHFYVTTTLINCGLGVATGLVMWAWGMPTPYLWGAMAAVLNYIPYAGALTILTVVTLVAIVSFNTLGPVLGVAGSYVALATIEGQVAQPLLVGRRMEVNPLLIFLALWFGGLFWGVAGIILATPTLVALKVIAENSESGRPLMEFLGPNNQKHGRDTKLRMLIKRGTFRGRIREPDDP
jgi:predicted PurR-regulated permease PerM